MTITDRAKRSGKLVLWLALAMLLLILTASPTGSRWMRSVGVPQKGIAIIQIIAITVVIVLIAMLAFVLAPLFGGLIAAILTIFGILLLIAAAVHIWQAMTSKITVTDSSGTSTGTESDSTVESDADGYDASQG